MSALTAILFTGGFLVGLALGPLAYDRYQGWRIDRRFRARRLEHERLMAKVRAKREA